MKGYIETLIDYADTIVDSGDFPQEHVSEATRFLAHSLVLGLFGNSAEKSVAKYAGFGSFGNAVVTQDWREAALVADPQNFALLGSWIKLVHWLGRKAEDLACEGIATNEDGIRYIQEG